MIGTLAGSGIALSMIYASMKWQETELKKIHHVFKNIGYRIKDQQPRLIKTNKKEVYTDYIFAVPYGLVDDPKLEPILQKTLIKPVSVMFRGKLIVRVYNHDLPTKIKYDWERSNLLPIGQSLDGMIYHDFDAIPHMTVAGMTRQGKTVFLKLILAHMINNHPDAVFYILDLKGGLEFGKYERFKQVKTVTSTVEETEQCLASILSRLKGDVADFKARGWNNIANTNDKRRTFIIVDEAAELADNKRCQKGLSETARIGGALGYRLIFATQYPVSDTLPRQIKQNSDAKITFRLPTQIASRVAIDENGAEELCCPGRAIYRTHDRQLIQVPYVTDNEILERLKHHVVDKRKNESTRTDIITLD